MGKRPTSCVQLWCEVARRKIAVDRFRRLRTTGVESWQTQTRVCGTDGARSRRKIYSGFAVGCQNLLKAEMTGYLICEAYTLLTRPWGSRRFVNAGVRQNPRELTEKIWCVLCSIFVSVMKGRRLSNATSRSRWRHIVEFRDGRSLIGLFGFAMYFWLTQDRMTTRAINDIRFALFFKLYAGCD